MNAHPTRQAHNAASAQVMGAAGTAPWQIAKGCAMTLRPRVAGTLQVRGGRAWATLDVHKHSALHEAGDHFIEPASGLVVQAGQRVVLEAWPALGQESMELLWVPNANASVSSRWSRAVLQPLREVGQGLALTGYAMLRLGAGLFGYTEFLAAGRGRVLSKLECNAP